MSVKVEIEVVDELPKRRGGGQGGATYETRYAEAFDAVDAAGGKWVQIAVYESTTGAANAKREMTKRGSANGYELASRVTGEAESRLYARAE